MVAISGTITRANLPSPLGPLDILVDPYWGILGDEAEAADLSQQAGVTAAVSTQKQVWADSPYVAGKQLVLATPDNSTLDLRVLIDGSSMADLETKVATLITAVRQQLTFTVQVNFDAASYAWNCFTADYSVAWNQLYLFGFLLPVYLTMARDPTPLLGPV
jgi:hypothetical protein